MELTHYTEAGAFHTRAVSFLLRHEAHHNLILGLSAGLIEQPERPEHPPYLATVQDGSEAIAAALMTPPNHLVLSLAPPEAVALIARDLHEQRLAVPSVLGPTDASRAFAQAWQDLTGGPYRRGMAQRVYQLDAVTPVPGVPGALRPATLADRDLLVEWLVAFQEEAMGNADRDQIERSIEARLNSQSRGLYLWHDDRPVSMAGYSGPTPNGIRIGAVYTPPEHRRRGYASACVAALSQHLLDSGRKHCYLFTDLSNPTSNHIYQSIGYRPVCDFHEYRFA